MRLLICGGRHYDDADAIRQALDRQHRERPVSVLVHGGLAGIGSTAEAWAREHNVHVIRYPPNWTLLGSRAEAHRNAFMLTDSRPDFVIAFPGGRDTLELLRMARAAGLPVLHARAGAGMTEAVQDGCEAAAEDQPEGRPWGAARLRRHHHPVLSAPLQ
ncbi:hypothetical protein BN1110_04402 [bacterium YEK0313]|nr:hypothetical protein BN1110_04402 [bacterium YEK0313]